MPAGPLAHICLLVTTSTARSRTGAVLGALDPAQLEEPIVRVERWEAGGDVMSLGDFVNPGGTRSSCSAR